MKNLNVKKNKKNFKNLLTNQSEYDIIIIEIKKRGNEK